MEKKRQEKLNSICFHINQVALKCRHALPIVVYNNSKYSNITICYFTDLRSDRNICYKIYKNFITIYKTITNVARQDMLVVCEAIGVCMLEQIVQGHIKWRR